MKLLGPIDILFLSLEKRQQPMHVASLMLFNIPPNAPSTFVQDLAAQLCDSSATPVAPFNQMLKGMFWGADEEFDVEQHVIHVALPQPGRIRELLAYVSHVHAALIDRAKPLWEMHIIEGIENNRFAIYVKIHHALMDGIGAFKLMEKTLQHNPYDRHEKPIWALELSKQKYKAKPSLLQNIKQNTKAVFSQIESVPMIGKELLHAVDELKHNPDYVSAYRAPRSILNQPISASRRFAAQSYQLERFRFIAGKLNITINDVILAICSGAMRTYLLGLNALPKKPLIAMVPVSVRREGDRDGGNQFSMILANLATHVPDPLERLHMIRRSVLNAKNRMSRMSQAAIINYSGVIYSLAGLNLVTGVLPKLQAFNLVISNVPGPKAAVYLNGAQLEGIYPASIVLDGQAMNITLASYMDKLEVGIVACRRTLPRIQLLLGYLEDELTILESMASQVK